MLGLLRNNAREFNGTRRGLLGSLFNQERSRPCQCRTPPAKHWVCSLTGRENSALLNTSNHRYRSRKWLWVKSGLLEVKAASLWHSIRPALHFAPSGILLLVLHIRFLFPFFIFLGEDVIELSHIWSSDVEYKKLCGLLELVVDAFQRRGRRPLRTEDFKPGVSLQLLNSAAAR